MHTETFGLSNLALTMARVFLLHYMATLSTGPPCIHYRHCFLREAHTLHIDRI